MYNKSEIELEIGLEITRNQKSEIREAVAPCVPGIQSKLPALLNRTRSRRIRRRRRRTAELEVVGEWQNFERQSNEEEERQNSESSEKKKNGR